MKALIKRFWQEDDALGTVEMVLLLEALLSVALVFKDKLTGRVSTSVESVFGKADSGVS